MFPLSIRMHFVTFLFVFVLSEAFGQDRKISASLNPGCTQSSNETTLVYIKATGSHDSIHQIWDFTRNMPTIIYAIGTVNSSLNISWDGPVPRKFMLSEKMHYSFAAVIDKLTEYDDIQDNGHIDLNVPHKNISFRHMIWRRGNNTILTDKEVMIDMKGYFKSERRGRVEFKLDILPFKDYAVQIPHLIHTANSTLVDISLVNLTLSKEYNASRYALHFILASTDNRTDHMRYGMRKSLDDEHTPGVFEIVEIKTPESALHEDGGFIQFRPVGYNEQERGVTTSTNAHISDFTNATLPPWSTIHDFYDAYNPDQLLVQDMYISFGETGDGFYKKHNYTSWSVTVGYGAPPLEGFSLFVIIIICIGLGVPVALALSGITYVLVRRYRSRNAPARFTDDD